MSRDFRELHGDSLRDIQIERIPYDHHRQRIDDVVSRGFHALGDTIIVIKKRRDSRHEIDETGVPGNEGNRGYTRSSFATGVQPTRTDFGRPEIEEDEGINNTYTIPVRIEIQRAGDVNSVGGVYLKNRVIAHFSTAILADKGIEIQYESDHFIYRSVRYKAVDRPVDEAYLLNHVGVLAVELEPVGR